MILTSHLLLFRLQQRRKSSITVCPFKHISVSRALQPIHPSSKKQLVFFQFNLSKSLMLSFNAKSMFAHCVVWRVGIYLYLILKGWLKGFRERNQTERRCCSYWHGACSLQQHSDFSWPVARLEPQQQLCDAAVTCKESLGRADISPRKHPRSLISLFLSVTKGLLLTVLPVVQCSVYTGIHRYTQVYTRVSWMVSLPSLANQNDPGERRLQTRHSAGASFKIPQ